LRIESLSEISKSLSIDRLESDITKWDKVDISIRDRIKTSEFSKYIQQALEIADKIDRSSYLNILFIDIRSINPVIQTS
jgi:hypothetical protein